MVPHTPTPKYIFPFCCRLGLEDFAEEVYKSLPGLSVAKECLTKCRDVTFVGVARAYTVGRVHCFQNPINVAWQLEAQQLYPAITARVCIIAGVAKVPLWWCPCLFLSLRSVPKLESRRNRHADITTISARACDRKNKAWRFSCLTLRRGSG